MLNRTSWAARQAVMEAGYRELLTDPEHAVLAYNSDFGPYREMLSSRTGRVLDVGGGNGLVRHFLPPATEYVGADPSLAWFEDDWRSLEIAFPCLAELPAFVQCVGERLPFGANVFDTVLMFWSLNHVADPSRVLLEAHRTLRAGGTCLIALEDVAPSWREIVQGSYQDERYPTRRHQARSKLWSLLFGWPLEADHQRVTGKDVRSWCYGHFDTEFSGRVGAYYTLDLRKL